MAEREQFLERVRQALCRSPSSSAPEFEALPPLGAVMPPIAQDELVPKFEAELQKVGGLTYRAANNVELDAILQKVLDAAQATDVVLSRNPLLTTLGIADRLRAWGRAVDVWPAQGRAVEADAERAYRERAFAAQVGITGADLALAESGTLVLTSLIEGSQLDSLAPPVHMAFYRRHQVVGSLEEVLGRLPVPRPGEPASLRSIVFVTGTSRTADIEQILVRGVHGPGELHAILVEDSCLR